MATLAVLLGLALAAAGLAATTSRLTGTVVGADGEPVRGVTITLSSDVLIGGPQTMTTDPSGAFAFNLLPPGLYRVDAEKPRYTPQVAAVAVLLDREARVEMQIAPVSYTEEVRVMASAPLLDRTRVHTGQTFDRVDLETMTIGSANRSYLAILQQAPGVGGDRVNWCSLVDGSSSNPRVAGSTFAENAYIFDGVGTTDPYSGTWLADLPFDAIQEVSIQTAGFDAEYGNATGGVVNLVTRSGGNKLSGSLDVRYNDDRFLTDGDHFDADVDAHDWRDLVLALGGPLLRDRLWFFASYDTSRAGTTPSDSPTTRVGEAEYLLGKLTWQPGPAWRLTAAYSRDPYDIDNADAAWYVAPEATGHWRQGGDIVSASVQGVLTAQLLWQAQLARQRSSLDVYPQSGDFSAIGRKNWGDLMMSGNATSEEFSDRDRDVVATSLEWLSSGPAGSHDLKGGIELSRRMFSGAQCGSGTATNAPCPAREEGIHFEDFGEPPLGMVVLTGPGFLDDESRQVAAYVQDAWSVSARLTLKLGLRWDWVDFRNASGADVATLAKVQPRIGAVLDLTGDGRTFLRGVWGRFMHPSALFLPDFTQRWSETEVWVSCTYFGLDEPSCQEHADDIGGRWRTDPVGYDPEGWVLFPGDTFGGPGLNAVDPGVLAPYSDQLSVAVERLLFDHTAVELTYLQKKTRDIIEDTCVGNLPMPSEGADCSSYVALNLPGLRRDYQATMLRVDSRVRDWLRVLASYVHSSSEGNAESTRLGYDYDLYPWHFENRDGYLSDDRRQRVKVNGYAFVPWDVTIGFSALWESAFRWQPYQTSTEAGGYGAYFTEPRGSREGSGYSQVDLQVSKGIRLGAVRVELIASVFNVFDKEGVIAVCEPVTCGDRLGEPTGWQYPRWYEAGLRITF